MRNLDAFSWIGLFSGASVSGDLKTAYNGVLANPADWNRRVHLLWIGAGSVETRLTTAIDASKALLDAHGIRNVVTYTSAGTSHEWHTWRRSSTSSRPSSSRNNTCHKTFNVKSEGLKDLLASPAA